MSTATAGARKTILLVDDQHFFVAVQQSILERQGYRVLTAADGPEGLAKAREHEPDLILLDVHMPGMDGFTVCEKLKQDNILKKIPVIILTSTQDAKVNDKAFRAGAEVTVLKSISAERFLNILRVVLSRGKSSAGL